SPIISATNDDRRTKLPPFEPPRCNESNGGSFNLLPPLDAEIISKTSKNRLFYRRFADYLGNERWQKDMTTAIRTASMRRIEWWWFRPMDAEIISKTSIK